MDDACRCNGQGVACHANLPRLKCKLSVPMIPVTDKKTSFGLDPSPCQPRAQSPAFESKQHPCPADHSHPLLCQSCGSGLPPNVFYFR